MLKRTPLHDTHVSVGARMVAFAGWDMPVQYSGPIQEHMAVREAAGVFDVSHMGEIEVQGADALNLIQQLTTNDVSKLEDDQVQYTVLTNEQACVIDDLLVYRIRENYFRLVVNAANTERDFEWMVQHKQSLDVEVHNTSSGYALLALQGPKAERILQELADQMLDRIPYYWSQGMHVDGVKSRVSRTGYTGENGFEILCSHADVKRIWNRLLVIGREEGLIPCGLAARNTLRLEAGFRLHGNDMDESTTPLEAGLGWLVKTGKGEFTGRAVLEKQRREGLKRKLIGFEMLDRAPARDGYPVAVDGREIGKVTSGSPAPFLKKNIGFAYMPVEHSQIGTEFFVVVRGRQVPARVVEIPFYKRDRKFD